MSDLYWPLPTFIGLVVLLTGVSVYLRDPSRRLNHVFLLESAVIFLWASANSLVIFNWEVPALRAFWDHVTYALGFPMAPVFALFSCYLPAERPPGRHFVWLSVIMSVVFAAVVFVPGLFTTEMGEKIFWNRIYLGSYCLAFIYFTAYGLRIVWIKSRSARSPLEQKQLSILQWGLLATFSLGVTAGIVAPLVAAGFYLMNLITVFATLIFAGFAGYSVLRYGFMASLRYAMMQIFKNFHAGIMISDYNGRIMRLNPMLAGMFSPSSDFTNREVTDFAVHAACHLIAGADRQGFQEWFLEDEDGEREFPFGGDIRRSFIINKKWIKDSNGFQAGRIYTFLDNTEMRRLTRELKESRDHLEALLENANDIIITCDIEGKITSANKLAVKLSGVQDGEWRGRNIYELIAPEYVEEAREWAHDWVRGKQASAVFRLDLLLAGGARIPLETTLNVIESNGEVIGVQAIARDLRPRLEAESQIRELEELNEQIIRNAPTGIFTLDKDGVFTSVNPAFVQIIGFDSAAALVGRNIFEFPGVQKYALDEPLRKVLSGNVFEQTLDFRTVMTDKQVSIKGFGTPLINKEGEVHGALIIVADLAREKELERQLVQSEKLSSIGKLISGVAHELNNPLTAIMGYSQFLAMDETLSEKPHQMAHKIQANAERCRKTVANLLGYVRMKQPEKCRVNVNELLDKTLELREYDFRVKNIEVRRGYQPDLPLTAADPDQLQQVFLNLINNAFDAMREKNGISGRLDVRTYESPGNFITIEFADTGPGINAAIHSKIFDPFFTTKPLGKGTGLGLSLSFGIMRSHGGSIRLDTSYQKGARFILRIPIETPPQQQAEISSGDGSPELLQHVLLVDDEEQILECTKLLLESKRYRVTTASNGEEARSRLFEQPFDAIITDIRMPGMIDGKSLYAIVRKEKPHLIDKMIFITGDTLDAETYNFLTKIPNRHVKKPFTSQELVSALQAVCGPACAE